MLMVTGAVLVVLAGATVVTAGLRLWRGDDGVVEVDASVDSVDKVMTSMVVGARGARRDVEQRRVHFSYSPAQGGQVLQGEKRMGVKVQARDYPVGGRARVFVRPEAPGEILLERPTFRFPLFLGAAGLVLLIIGLALLGLGWQSKGT